MTDNHRNKPASIPGAEAQTALPVTLIEPGQRGLVAEAEELWRFRELFYFLVWRDVKVRYKQTLIGAAWAILKPFGAMVVFSIFFGRLAGIPSDGVPYPLFIYAALVPWQFFSSSLTRSTGSLVGSANLVRKVYFPRIIVPAAGALAGVVDFALASLIMFAMMVYYGFSVGLPILALPALVLLAYLVAVGVGAGLAAANVRFRDIGFITGFLVEMWMFVSPVVYPLSLAPEKYRALMFLNPMTGVIEGFRWSFIGRPFPGVALLYSCVCALVLLAISQWYFRRVERAFADLI
jgi:lipopolysaccharide transport system permease protein